MNFSGIISSHVTYDNIKSHNMKTPGLLPLSIKSSFGKTIRVCQTDPKAPVFLGLKNGLSMKIFFRNINGQF